MFGATAASNGTAAWVARAAQGQFLKTDPVGTSGGIGNSCVVAVVATARRLQC